jgi:hypothetical protein
MKTNLLKTMLMALVMMGSASVFAQTVYVNTSFAISEGWPAAGSQVTTRTAISNITCADAVVRTFYYYYATMGTAKITVNKGPSAGIANGGYVEVNVPKVATVTITAATTGTSGRDFTIWASTDGTTWTQIGTCLIGSSTVTISGLNYLSPTAIRVANIGTSGGRDLKSIYIAGPASDPTPPAYVSASSNPINGATGISPTISSLSVAFDRNIVKGTGDITITDGITPQTVLLSNCTFLNQTLSIPVSGILSLSKTYTVTIPTGAIQNSSAVPTTQATTFSFSTKDVLSSAAEITSISFGARQIGSSVINTNTIDVTLMPATSLTTLVTPILAQISTPVITVSTSATVVFVPTDFAASIDIIVLAEDGSPKTWTVNFTEAAVTAATLPVAMLGVSSPDTWLNSVQTGYVSNILNASSGSSISSTTWYAAQLTKTNQFIMIKYTGVANTVKFRARYGNNTSNYKLDVQESPDGTNWTNIVSYLPSNLLYDADGITVLQPTVAIPDPAPMVPIGTASFGVLSYPVLSTSRYIRWFYTIRSNTTFYLDDVNILFDLGTSLNSLNENKQAVSQKENALILSDFVLSADLYNVLGAKVQSFRSSVLNTGNLPKGIYVVNYTTNKLTQGNSKVIIK